MTYEIVSVLCGGAGPNLGSEKLWNSINNRDNARSPCVAYQQLLDACQSEVIIYVHDDVSIHDANWLPLVLAHFSYPNTVAVGLGGATGLGHPDLYKRPYSIWNLARFGYGSNQDDWAVHGAHVTGSRRVAVLEQFFMAIRTDWLRSIGGWPTQHLRHHCLDHFIACEAARAKKEVWQVGVSCLHSGGGTSTTEKYKSAKWLAGGTMEEDHLAPHRYIFETYRDILPLAVV